MIMNFITYNRMNFQEEGNVNHLLLMNPRPKKSYNHQNRTTVSQMKMIVRQKGKVSLKKLLQ
jgi:hypothetical protein